MPHVIPDFESWEFHPSRIPKDHSEQEAFALELEKRFLAELQANPEVAAYTTEYDEKSVEQFLKAHARHKAHLVKIASYYMSKMETHRELRYPEDTHDAFNFILHKKLFNLELLWRAEQITLPGVRISIDFHDLHRQVDHVSFIDTVTPEEVEAMRQYLRAHVSNVHGRELRFDHDGYSEIMERSEAGDLPNMPDWYEHYDLMMGTGHLLLLPDIRGEKEGRYMSAWREKMRPEWEAARAAYTPPKKHLSLHGRERVDFTRRFDDACFYALHAYEADSQERHDAAEARGGVFDVDSIIHRLQEIENPPLVQRAGIPWQQAVNDCWHEYWTGTIADDLDLVYDTYLFYRETGLQMGDEENESGVSSGKMADSWADHILDGREALGEPRDFDF